MTTRITFDFDAPAFGALRLVLGRYARASCASPRLSSGTRKGSSVREQRPGAPTKSMVHSCWIVNAPPLLLGKVERIRLLSAKAGQIAVPSAAIRGGTANSDA